LGNVHDPARFVQCDRTAAWKLADGLIAATCLRLNASIATDNVADFRPFEPMGLQIMSSV
jgi:predicted nucleic acid-binding protein